MASPPCGLIVSALVTVLVSLVASAEPPWRVSGADHKQHSSRTWLSSGAVSHLSGHSRSYSHSGYPTGVRSQTSWRHDSGERQYLDEIPCGTNKFSMKPIAELRSSGRRAGHSQDDDRYVRKQTRTKFTRSMQGEKVFSADESFFMAMLRVVPASGSETYCSGVLISDRHVLTAAHCLATCHGKDQRIVDSSNVTASLGKSYERWDYSLQTKFSTVTVHPSFNGCEPDYSYDIAILQISEPVAFSKTLNRICLPSNELQTANIWAKFYGYGLMSNTNDGYSQWRRLNAAGTYILPRCDQYPIRYSGQMLCANSNFGAHPCQGDSGGPLVIKQNNVAILLGLNSVTGVDLTKYTDCYVENAGRADSYRPRFVSIKFLIDWIGSMMEDRPNLTTTSTPIRTTVPPTLEPGE